MCKQVYPSCDLKVVYSDYNIQIVYCETLFCTSGPPQIQVREADTNYTTINFCSIWKKYRHTTVHLIITGLHTQMVSTISVHEKSGNRNKSVWDFFLLICIDATLKIKCHAWNVPIWPDKSKWIKIVMLCQTGKAIANSLYWAQIISSHNHFHTRTFAVIVTFEQN